MSTVAFILLLLVGAPVAAACSPHHDPFPAWIRFPDGGEVLDAVWVDDKALLARQSDTYGVELVWVADDERAYAPGPYWPLPFGGVGSWVVIGHTVYAVGAAGDRIVELNVTSGASSVWDARLPRGVIRAPATVHGDAIYMAGGVWKEIDRSAVDGGENATKGRSGVASDEVVRIDPANRTVEILPIRLPGEMWGGALVSDGDAMYLVAGSGTDRDIGCGLVCKDIVRLDVTSMESEVIDIEASRSAFTGIADAWWAGGQIFVIPGSESSQPVRGGLLRVDPSTGEVSRIVNMTLREISGGLRTPTGFLWFGTKWADVSKRTIDHTDLSAPTPIVDARIAVSAISASVDASAQYVNRTRGPTQVAEVTVDWGDCGVTRGEPHEHRHTYWQPARYNVTTYLMDGRGSVGWNTTEILANTAPTVTMKPAVTNLSVWLDLSIKDPDPVDKTSVTIDWGDGTINSNRSHWYASSGRYRITASVTDRFGAEAEAMSMVQAVEPWVEPAAHSTTWDLRRNMPALDLAIVLVCVLAVAGWHTRRPRG